MASEGVTAALVEPRATSTSLMTFYDQGLHGRAVSRIGVRNAHSRAMLASPHFLFRLRAAPRHRVAPGAVSTSWTTPIWRRGSRSTSGRRRPTRSCIEPGARRSALADPEDELEGPDPIACSPSPQVGESLASRFAVAVAASPGPRRGCIPNSLLFPVLRRPARRLRCGARPSSSSSTSCAAVTAAVLELLTADYTFVNERSPSTTASRA